MTADSVCEVRQSKIHGLGLFAIKPIRKGDNIIEYVGEKISKEEGTRRSELHPFIFILNDEFDIDGSVDYNMARFANHSCDPNAEFVNDDGTSIWIRAIRDIEPDEEIVYDYCFESSERLECRCGAPNCCGYMNEPTEEESDEEDEEEEDDEDEEHEQQQPPKTREQELQDLLRDLQLGRQMSYTPRTQVLVDNKEEGDEGEE